MFIANLGFKYTLLPLIQFQTSNLSKRFQTLKLQTLPSIQQYLGSGINGSFVITSTSSDGTSKSETILPSSR